MMVNKVNVWKATNYYGETCYFGVESLAKAWAKEKGSVEKVEAICRDFKIASINGITRFDIDADNALFDLIGGLKSFVLCGYNHQGDEVFQSTVADGADALWIMERCKLKLLNIIHED